jgi:hypothetical protein
MALLPPLICPADFQAVATSDELAIARHFGGEWVRSLHSYLNALPCVGDIQDFRRRKLGIRVRNPQAFGTFATDSGHWYTFHHGGRNEAQFNFGLRREYARVGLGFEFSEKKGGDPNIVQLAYSCFVHVVRNNQAAFEALIAKNLLEVEWVSKVRVDDLRLIPSVDVTKWILKPTEEPYWIFVGRLLRSGADETTLGDATRLGELMDAVFSSLRPLWEQTQALARSG